MAAQLSVSQEISAPPERIWDMVADLPRMGEWSPENEGARWLRRATGPQTGVRFRGRNRNGKKRWSTSGRIVECAPGSLLSWRVSVAGIAVADWRYEFEPTAGGCQVTETWFDRRGWLAKALGGPVSGVADRAAHNRAGMEETLRRLKVAAESPLPR